MYGGNYAGPYQGAPDQSAVAPVGQYQAPQPQQQMPGQQPMMGQPQQQMPGQQPMMGQPQQQMPGQQPMMDQPQQMPGQQPMMDQPPQMPGQQPMMDQPPQMPGQQPMMDTPDAGPSGGITETASGEQGKTWMIVTILAGLGIAAVLVSLLMLFLRDATTVVDTPSILLLVASIFGIVCLATAFMYNSGNFTANKMIPGSTGVLACLVSGGAIGMGFSDLEISAYILIAAALVFLVGGILGFLAKSSEKSDTPADGDDSLESFLSEQPAAPEQQQMPPEQQFPGQQQMPPEQQFPGQQPMPQQQMPPEQQFPGQQPTPQQQMPPGQQFPGQQPMPQQQMPPGQQFPGQQPMPQQQMFGGYPPQ